MSSFETPFMSVYSKPFWDGVEERRLRLPWCTSCEKPHFPPRPFCPHCWADEIEWRDASGRATLYTYTTVLANPPSTFKDALPYTIGIVRLAEGDVQMMTHVEGDLEGIGCDVAVEVTWKQLHGRTLPAFKLVRE